jgi:NTE family protein
MKQPDKTVGLVLGGGLVRGLAHVGVVTVLEEAGIPIHLIAGASAGSIVGAGYAAGLGAAKLREMALRLRWWHLGVPVIPLRGFVSFVKLERWLTGFIGDITFDQLETRFTAVTTDIDTGERVALQQGRVAHAVRASCSIPGLVTPVKIDGRYLVDGAISDNLPVAVVRDLGVNYVIAVDVMQPKVRRRWGALGYGFAGIELLIEHSGSGGLPADCQITPNLAGATYFRFARVNDLIARGEAAARAALPQIKADLYGSTDFADYTPKNLWQSVPSADHRSGEKPKPSA